MESWKSTAKAGASSSAVVLSIVYAVFSSGHAFHYVRSLLNAKLQQIFPFKYNLFTRIFIIGQKSQYDEEIPQSHTVEQPTAP